MDEEQGELLLRISQQLQRAADRMDRIHHTAVELAANTIPHHASQTTTVNNGDRSRSVAIWVCSFCCLTMFFMAWTWREDQMKQAIQYNDQSRRLDLANDKLSIILQWAPKLSKEVDDEMQRRQERHK